MIGLGWYPWVRFPRPFRIVVDKESFISDCFEAMMVVQCGMSGVIEPSYLRVLFVFDPNRPQTRSVTRAISLMNHHCMTHHEDEDDRISQFPDDILHHILHFIPFKNTVGTYQHSIK